MFHVKHDEKARSASIDVELHKMVDFGNSTKIDAFFD